MEEKDKIEEAEKMAKEIIDDLGNFVELLAINSPSIEEAIKESNDEKKFAKESFKSLKNICSTANNEFGKALFALKYNKLRLSSFILTLYILNAKESVIELKSVSDKIDYSISEMEGLKNIISSVSKAIRLLEKNNVIDCNLCILKLISDLKIKSVLILEEFMNEYKKYELSSIGVSYIPNKSDDDITIDDVSKKIDSAINQLGLKIKNT